ncbi:MAG: hypothetical protein HYU57_01190 [Micavibrio aeruginosavorus]|nr:hypothetical protein [Micavibrio aeruginosavorus]
MTLQIDAVQQTCRAIALQVRDHARTLHLSFIVHHNGEKLESLSLAGQELLAHPAGENAIQLMRNQSKAEHSDFLGLAAWRERRILDLTGGSDYLALTTLNVDEFESLREVKAQAWHMAWHAIFHHGLRYKADYKDAFADGIIQPLYSAEDRPSANMHADVFSAALCNLDGDRDAARRIAHRRCAAALSRNHGIVPENYPFPLAMETVQVALADMIQRPPSKKRAIPASMLLADKISGVFDDGTLKQWIFFCKPAQNMAWRGDKPETILGAAVCTSQDTFIRATGFLVADIMHVTPLSVTDLDESHSPFAEDRYNQRLHESMVERAFEKAASACVSDRSGSSFTEAANEQNRSLSEGHIFGWCAAALQAAGQAFESAMANGSKTAIQDARRQFEETRHKTTWESLKQLGETIIAQYRNGYAVTFSDILEFCGTTPALAGVSCSIAVTMKDPSYLSKLDVANDLSPKNIPELKPAPAAAPRAPAPVAAAPVMKAPGFGPGGSGGMTAHKAPASTAPPPAQPATATSEEDDDFLTLENDPDK